MEDRDTIKLLKECDAGSKMAVSSLKDILDKVENVNLKKLLDETKDHHEKLGNEIHSLLMEYGCEEKDPNINIQRAEMALHRALTRQEVKNKR